MSKTSSKAFTLIEIMIVIIIMGIMAAFALPSMARTKEKAIAGEAISVLSIYHRAMLRYQLETGNIPADCNVLDVDLDSATLKNFIGPYCYPTSGTIEVVRNNKKGEGTGQYSIRVDKDGNFFNYVSPSQYDTMPSYIVLP